MRKVAKFVAAFDSWQRWLACACAVLVPVTTMSIAHLVTDSRNSAVASGYDTAGQLSLPFGAAQSWTLTQGPHNWAASGPGGTVCPPSYLGDDCHPWSSLDLTGGDNVVRAAHAGYARINDCNGNPGIVRIDDVSGGNYDGWHTTYYHLTNVSVTQNQWINRGDPVGNTGETEPCGGNCIPQGHCAHVHFSVWYFSGTTFTKSDSQAVDLGGQQPSARSAGEEQIGEYSITDGSTEGSGCMANVSNGQQICPGGSLYNDGSVAGSACNAGTVTPVTGTHAVAAAAVDANSTTHLFVAGVDGAVWHQQYAYKSTTWNCVGAGVIEGSVAALQYGSTGTNIILVVRWADDSIHWATYDGSSGCCTWSNLGDGIGGSDPVLAVFNNQLHAVVAARDGTVWEATYGGSSWSGWSQIGPAVAGKPAVAVSSGGQLIYAGREKSDNKLIWASAPAVPGGWSLIPSPGYLIGASDPTLSIDGLQLMIAAYGSDSEVWTNAYTGTAWSSWSPQNGHILGNPAAFTWHFGHYLYFHVFVRGLDNALYDCNGCSGTWSSDGGVLTNDPIPIGTGTTFDVLARGADGALWDYDSASGWASQGGQLR